MPTDRSAADKLSARPGREALAEAAGRTLADVIGPGLRILFCGINPGLYSAAAGFHFARPGNRFWPVLHGAGFTRRLLAPAEQRELLQTGYGLTNLVDRATASASELAAEELAAGGLALESKLRRYRPRMLAILGISAFRTAFGEPKATLGLQAAAIAATPVWVLPNPSGVNAHYRLPDLVRLFAELREAVDVGG